MAHRYATAIGKFHRFDFRTEIGPWANEILELSEEVELEDKTGDGHISKALERWIKGEPGFKGGFFIDVSRSVVAGAVVTAPSRGDLEVHALVVHPECEGLRVGRRLFKEVRRTVRRESRLLIVNKPCMRKAQGSTHSAHPSD